MDEIKSLQRDWNDLAKIDPMWAIVSDPNKTHGKWDPKEFFDSGRYRLDRFFSIAQEAGLSLPPGTALDFGCGIGRLTQALAEKMNTCYGVDISPEMISLAKTYNRFTDKVNYIVNPKNDLSIFDTNFFDLIISDVVLQHMPPFLMKGYLREFIRVLKPAGALIFQVPIEFTVQDLKTAYLKSLPKFHPLRIRNKLKGILMGHDKSERYYRLRKMGISKKWLYEKFGFRPKIDMYLLTETEIHELMVSVNSSIINTVKESTPDLISGIIVVVKGRLCVLH